MPPSVNTIRDQKDFHAVDFLAPRIPRACATTRLVRHDDGLVAGVPGVGVRSVKERS
jgi:hypothetical protein